MSASTGIDQRSHGAGARFGTRLPAATVLALVLGTPLWVGPAHAAATVSADTGSQAGETPTSPPSNEQPKTQPPPLGNVEKLSPNDAASVLGKKVIGPKGEDLGLIVDTLVSSDGKPRAAVIDFGGFLGVGSRKIAIDWKALDFTSLGRAGTAELGLQRAQIAAAPEYKSGAPEVDVVTAPPAPAPPVDVPK